MNTTLFGMSLLRYLLSLLLCSAPRSTTQHHAAPRSTTQHHAAPRSTSQHLAAPRSTSQYHAAPRNTTQHHATPRSTQHLNFYLLILFFPLLPLSAFLLTIICSLLNSPSPSWQDTPSVVPKRQYPSQLNKDEE